MPDRQVAEADRKWGRRNTSGVVIASSLRFEGVFHNYKTPDGDMPTLQDVSLEVAPGEVVCLLGPSGSGKTTLLKLAAGLAMPTKGEVLIDNLAVSSASSGAFVPPEKRGVGLVFQDFALFPHLNVIRNVEFGLTALGSGERKMIAERMLDRVGLSQYAQSYPHQLSGGEQQRVALARALAPRPGILLMDEPFSGLDARLRENIREETLGLLRDTRSTVLIVTHDPEEALNAGHKIALMKEGSIVQFGESSALYENPQSLFAAEFFSELNILPATPAAGSSGGAPGFDTPLGSITPRNDCMPEQGGEYILCVRPSDFTLLPAKKNNAEKAAGKAGAGIAGRIIERRFLGDDEIMSVLIRGHDDRLKIRIRAGELPASIPDVLVSVEKGKGLVFPKQ